MIARIRSAALAVAAAAPIAMACLAGPAAAQSSPGQQAPAASGQQAQGPAFTRFDADDGVEMLREAGYGANIIARNDRSVEIESRMSGLRVYLTLFGCQEGRQCRSAQLRLTATLNFFGMNPEQRSDIEAALVGASRWNDYRRYTRATVYFSERQRQHLIAFDDDISFEGGVTREAVKVFIQRYDELAGEFATFFRNADNRRMANF